MVLAKKHFYPKGVEISGFSPSMYFLLLGSFL